MSISTHLSLFCALLTVSTHVYANNWDDSWSDATGQSGVVSDGRWADTDGFADETDFYRGDEEDASPSDAIELLDLGEDGGVMGRYPRTQITANRTWPWRTMGLILSTKPNGKQSSCSGTLVGPRHVLTAGHCLYSGKAFSEVESKLGWHTDVVFIPGKKEESEPYGRIKAARLHSVKGFTKEHNAQFDYGMIILSQDVGEKTGWMAAGHSKDVSKMSLNFTGYPGDKEWGTLWKAFCPVDRTKTTAEQIYHQCDVYPGQSGGPSYQFRASDDSRIIYGINSGMQRTTEYNFSKRITEDALNRVIAWKEL